MNPEIFREYDIRGIADRELTDDVVRAVGRAFAHGTGAKALFTDIFLSCRKTRDVNVRKIEA